jgi:beta-glucosidase
MGEHVLEFPKDFFWGTATSSHQVEGGNTNNWSQWENIPGKIRNNDKSGNACGWWESMEVDLSLMKQMNHNTHRMSIEWSRIEPEEGKFNEAAIQRYKEMIRSLKDVGIEPMVTLHHFTNPIWLENKGAWTNEASIQYFKRYVTYVVEHLGDDVRLWCTINEPEVYAVEGHMLCYYPPGKFSLALYFSTTINLLSAHLAAYEVIKAKNYAAQVGIVKNYQLFDPLDENSFFDKLLAKFLDRYFNRIVIDPFVFGKFTFPLPYRKEEIARLKGKTDFFGLNYYTRWRVKATLGSPATMLANIFNITPGAQVSDITKDGNPYGEIYPEGIYRAIKIVSAINKPIYITETGLPDADDSRRPRFLLTHLRQVHKAIKEGFDVRGIYHWSLTDNFEWADGWALRFGLVAFDQNTGERKMRASGKLFCEIVKAGAITQDMVKQYAPDMLSSYFE